MKRELGIARCCLACCLCTEKCSGCSECADKAWCENRLCSIKKGIDGCYLCNEDCHKGLLAKIKPYGFKQFIKRFGITELLNCLEHNEQNGIVYHRKGVIGDYDDFTDVEELINFIKTGVKTSS